jgi:hypothetical protein
LQNLEDCVRHPIRPLDRGQAGGNEFDSQGRRIAEICVIAVALRKPRNETETPVGLLPPNLEQRQKNLKDDQENDIPFDS